MHIIHLYAVADLNCHTLIRFQVLDLESTLAVSISKSGGTRETKNNLVAIEAAFASAGIDAAGHLAAVTMPGSKLDTYANAHKWLKIWPMAESIGGRTSETAIVGHVPAAATGISESSAAR